MLEKAAYLLLQPGDQQLIEGDQPRLTILMIQGPFCNLFELKGGFNLENVEASGLHVVF